MDQSAKKLASVFNLSEYEAKLYISALDMSEATISDLSSRSGIPRTAVYPPLKQLITKGFISPLKTKGKRMLYRAIEPKYLEHIFDRKRIDLKEIISQFTGSISGGSGELWVRYFEGRNGLQMAGDILLFESKSKLWKSFENPISVEKILGTDRFDDYVKRRVEKGIFGRLIINAGGHTSWVKNLIAKKDGMHIDVLQVSLEVYPIEATVVVAGEWVFIESATQKPFALLIKNLSLARTIESVHDMVWGRFNN
ncbi:MAG: helix-turn-helix domain-containing protein [bacterium]|nr:helix-turn-helix domain-containing protein [bacterium]